MRGDQRARSEALRRTSRSVRRHRHVCAALHFARERQQRALGAPPRGSANRSISHRLCRARRDLAVAVLADEHDYSEVAEVPHVAEQLAVPQAEDDRPLVLPHDVADLLMHLAHTPGASENAHADPGEAGAPARAAQALAGARLGIAHASISSAMRATRSLAPASPSAARTSASAASIVARPAV